MVREMLMTILVRYLRLLMFTFCLHGPAPVYAFFMCDVAHYVYPTLRLARVFRIKY